MEFATLKVLLIIINSFQSDFTRLLIRNLQYIAKLFVSVNRIY